MPVHDVDLLGRVHAAEILGSKWTALLVHDMSEGPRRFTELEHSCPGISPRTLLGAAALRSSRRASSPGTCYAEIAAAGRVRADGQGAMGLLPVIEEMRRFGHAWLVEGEPALGLSA